MIQTSDKCDDLLSQLAQRRYEASQDPEQVRFVKSREAAKPTLESIAARFIDPDVIAAQERRAALDEEANAYREQCHRESAWRAFVDRRGSRYAECTLDNFEATDSVQKVVLARMQRYRNSLVDNIEAGIGILLYGPCGTGKDHLLIELVKLAIAAGKSVTWFNGGNLFGMFRDNMDEDEKEEILVNRLVRPDLLYLSDPLPPLEGLPWFRREILYRVLDARYSRGRPLWVTTNVNSDSELDGRMGPECGQRLRDGAICLFCNWPSHRKPAREVRP